MEKRLYNAPQTEVEMILSSSMILAGSPTLSPAPPHGPSGAPSRGDIIP
ncbi:MAG: hypothetical protein IJV61_05140 [Paludibacteraceae bacterium]|nr:hypothetical protein [Paludibacteraceae bacterium]